MRKVTLTFDNGPEPDVTPQVLDCLARHNLKATFFVLGKKVSDPERAVLARRALAEGHHVGNHTFSHMTPLGELAREAALDEFRRTEQAIAALGDQQQRLFRPYGGRGTVGPHLLHPAVVEKLQSGGYTCVLWNCVPRDFNDPDGWVDRAFTNCRTRDWSLVVLHDIPSGAMAHLDTFIRRLKDDGVEIVQDYPPDCTPIVKGRIVLSIDPYVQGLSGIRR